MNRLVLLQLGNISVAIVVHMELMIYIFCKKYLLIWKNPQETTIEINKSSLTFTDKVLENKKNTDNIITRVDRVERGYINNGSITDIANETIENSSVF